MGLFGLETVMHFAREKRVQFLQRNCEPRMFFKIRSKISVVVRHFADFRMKDKQNTSCVVTMVFIGLFVVVSFFVLVVYKRIAISAA